MSFKYHKIAIIILICTWILSSFTFAKNKRPIPHPIIADKPRDGVFKITLDSYGACVFAKKAADNSAIYPSIDYDSSQYCKLPASIWRYDVLNRITTSYKIAENKLVNLCLSENTVYVPKVGKGQTHWQFKNGYKWDYLYLIACATNDPRQQWLYIRTSSPEKDYFENIVTGNRIGYTNWTLASSNTEDFSKYLYSFSIPRNQPWLQKKAQPKSLEMNVTLGWEFNNIPHHSFGDNNGKVRYSPKTKQITWHSFARLLCLTSNQINDPATVRWEWTSWNVCADSYKGATTPKSQQWTIDTIPNLKLTKGQLDKKFYAIITDANGNFLRIKQAGHNMGYPYTFNPKYIKEDISYPGYHATSIFTEDGTITDWFSLAIGNELELLQQCPAPGLAIQKTCFEPIPQDYENILPRDFIFTIDWLERLYAIATTMHDPHAGSLGIICGTCMIQALEMLANFNTYGTNAPDISAPGILFSPYSPVISPISQFRQAFPGVNNLLAAVYQRIHVLAFASGADPTDVNYNPTLNTYFHDLQFQSVFTRTLGPNGIHAFFTSSIRAPLDRPPTPYSTRGAIEPDDLNETMQILMAQPPGTLWNLSYVFGLQSGQGETIVGHSLLLIRVEDEFDSGISVIHTNVSQMFPTFNQFFNSVSRVYNTPESLYHALVEHNPTLTYVYEIDIYQMARLRRTSFFQSTISYQSCDNSTTGGAAGYGTGNYQLAPRAINLCGSFGTRCVNGPYQH